MHSQKPEENPVIVLGLLVLACLALATPVRCQELKVLPAKYQAAANRLVDKSPRKGGLNCSIEREKPYPDFTFHFDAGYYMTCPFWQFGGKDTRIGIFVQVTPRGRAPVVLGTYGVFRGSTAKLSPMVPGKGKAEFDVAGGFSVGEGHYHVKVLIRDSHGRSCSRRWKIKVTPREQRKVPVVLAAHQVAPLQIPAWHGPQSRGGLRLTVLLSATAFSHYAARLRSWNQTMLLQILSALLQQTPCKSVRLVAFNLDRQRVIYRADSFEPSGFARLQHAFNHLNLAVVSVHALKRRNDWAEWLAGLANQQIAADPMPDAVIFLGRTVAWTHKVPQKLLSSRETEKPRFFYFENGPWNLFPDALGYLTKSLGGKIYRINTPHDLGKAIQNMLAQLRQTGPNAEGW
ncbi:MAG: hypothetical protein P8Z30_10765 [Acidobacteriota bacterium]